MELILFILVWFGCAIACSVIAEAKGQGGCLWFILGACFGLLALLIVAILPSSRARKADTGHPPDYLLPCPYCLKPIPKPARRCSYCGADVVPIP